MKLYRITVLVSGGGMSEVMTEDEIGKLKGGTYGPLSCIDFSLAPHPGLYDLTFRGRVYGLSAVGAQRRALRHIRRWIKSGTEVVIYAEKEVA